MKMLTGWLCMGAMIASLLLATLGPLAQTFRPVVRGKRGAVATGHPLAAEAGLRLLQRGGNAVDAGCAAILAASVVEFSHFSFGGEVPILIKTSKGGPAVINGQGTAPRLATREFFLGRERKGDYDKGLLYTGIPGYVSVAADGGVPGLIPSLGILSATVPGLLDGIVKALDRFGTKSLAEVIGPAIELADGAPIDELRVRYIERTRKLLESWPTTARVFLPQHRTPKLGEIFSQPDLARTFRELVEAEGRAASGGRHEALMSARDYFYKGPVAKRISDFCEANGGLIRAADLASFEAKVEDPTMTEYRGYKIYKTGFWGQGPVLLQALNILEGFDLRSWRHNSADYIHTLVEAMKLAFADRDRYYGDPDFTLVPGSELLSKEYAADRRSLIDMGHASLDQRPGNPLDSPNRLRGSVQPSPTGESAVPEEFRAHDTTCVNVVDNEGNLFSATPSGGWLPGVVAADTGVMLGQRLQSFLLTEGHPNVLEPGKRPRITLSPTLVLKDDRPFLALSSPGADNQDQALLQVLLNIIEFGMSVQEAVEAPRFDSLHLVSSFDDHRFVPGVLNLEERIRWDVADELVNRGHRVKLQTAWGTPSAPTVILFRPGAGVIEAGADPRRGRYAVAW